MYLDDYLKEIDARLGPIIRELGLEAVSDDEREGFLFFQREDEDGVVWRSPVGFWIIPPEFAEQDEPTWGTMSIGLGNGKSRVVQVGTNGWVQYVGGWSGDFYQIGEEGDFADWDEAFEAAAKGLRIYPPVPEDYDIPGILNEGELHEFWPFLKATCEQHGIDDVDVGRDDNGFEFYQFEYSGSTFQVLWNLTHDAHLLKDGKECFSADIHDYVAMQEAIEVELQNLSMWPGSA
ncbi:hypothetical protein ACU8M5_10475 [Rhizobium leguminosarum]